MTIRRNRPLRGAIVGFGNVAVEGHLPTFQADRHYDILAVCDADEARLALAAERLPAARRYTGLGEMLDHERLDFVDVATPPATHPAIACEVLARNVHVLCEKPLATHVDDCNQIRSAATAAHAVVFTVHNWKYAPLFRTAKRALRRGEIGAVTHVTLETLRSEPPGGAAGGTWRLDPALAGGGVLVDHGWHAFYLTLYLLDADPIAVTARTAQRKFVVAGVEDTANCTIEFPGASVEIFLTWAADERRNQGRIVGEHGTIDLGDRKLAVAVRGHAPVETTFARPLSEGSYHPDWFTALAADFREELLDPKLHGVNFREAENTCRLVELCYRSSAMGGTRLAFHEPIPAAGA